MQKNLIIVILLMIESASITAVITAPMESRVIAASMADVQVQTGENSNSNSSGAIAAAGSSSSGGGPGQMFITILPDKPVVSPGSGIGYIITARTENGTAIPDANISSIVVDYGTGKNKMLMSGETNDKGELKITTQTGPNTHPGQLLITAVGSHNGFNDAKASTGVIVDSSSSTDSKGKCSGSGCK